jgi:hypothetical protein
MDRNAHVCGENRERSCIKVGFSSPLFMASMITSIGGCADPGPTLVPSMGGRVGTALDEAPSVSPSVHGAIGGAMEPNPLDDAFPAPVDAAALPGAVVVAVAEWVAAAAPAPRGVRRGVVLEGTMVTSSSILMDWGTVALRIPFECMLSQRIDRKPCFLCKMHNTRG